MGLFERLREKRALRYNGSRFNYPPAPAWLNLYEDEHNAMGPILDALKEIEENLNTAVHYAEHDDHEKMCLRCLAEDAITKAWQALDRLDASSADVTGSVD